MIQALFPDVIYGLTVNQGVVTIQIPQSAAIYGRATDLASEIRGVHLTYAHALLVPREEYLHLAINARNLVSNTSANIALRPSAQSRATNTHFTTL